MDHFPYKFVVQLNDTHPAIAIAEFMRLLIDEHQMDWDPPGASPNELSPIPITHCCRKPWKRGLCDLFQRILPRHLDIIYKINARFLDEVRSASWRQRAPEPHVADR